MVLLVGMRLGLFTDEYGPLYEEIAEKHGALYIPQVLKGILSDPKLKSDSIHPNGAGYQLMAERILEQVKPLLEEADRKLKGSRV
jgi:acyl-CoA thioesterase-1